MSPLAKGHELARGQRSLEDPCTPVTSSLGDLTTDISSRILAGQVSSSGDCGDIHQQVRVGTQVEWCQAAPRQLSF